jgi:hypothetical protein
VTEKTRLTNAGKKEQRQFEQILNKAVKEGTYQADGAARDVESRTVPKGHSLKAKGGK